MAVPPMPVCTPLDTTPIHTSLGSSSDMQEKHSSYHTSLGARLYLHHTELAVSCPDHQLLKRIRSQYAYGMYYCEDTIVSEVI